MKRLIFFLLLIGFIGNTCEAQRKKEKKVSPYKAIKKLRREEDRLRKKGWSEDNIRAYKERAYARMTDTKTYDLPKTDKGCPPDDPGCTGIIDINVSNQSIYKTYSHRVTTTMQDGKLDVRNPTSKVQGVGFGIQNEVTHSLRGNKKDKFNQDDDMEHWIFRLSVWFGTTETWGVKWFDQDIECEAWIRKCDCKVGTKKCEKVPESQRY